MKIKVCVGSNCTMMGADGIIASLENLKDTILTKKGVNPEFFLEIELVLLNDLDGILGIPQICHFNSPLRIFRKTGRHFQRWPAPPFPPKLPLAPPPSSPHEEDSEKSSSGPGWAPVPDKGSPSPEASCQEAYTVPLP